MTGISAEGTGALLHSLLALAVVVAAARGAGALARRLLGQPPVVGEIVAGIALGPSLLGAVAPAAEAFLFPEGAVATLDAIAKGGALLYMVIVGLETDPRLLLAGGRRAPAIAVANVGGPLLVGAALALLLFPRYAPAGVGVFPFALFLGVSLSITAFPVLARILTDLELQRTPVGSLALACAAAGDLLALAMVAALAGTAGTGAAEVIWSLGLAGAFLGAVVFRVAVPGGGGASHPAGEAAPDADAAPGGNALSSRLARLRALLIALVLPAFFAYAGLRADLGLLASPAEWFACGALVAAAVLGKLGGAYAAGRLVGLDPREARTVGILLNTRGLMELVVIGIGLEVGILSPPLFTMLVIMALVTTFATVPLLRRAYGPPASPPDPARRGGTERGRW